MANVSVDYCWSAGLPLDLSNFPQSNGKIGPDYLRWLSDVVSTHNRKTLDLKSPAGARWTIGDLDDTIYRGKDDEVNGWGKFYLPEVVSMQVVGIVEGTSCPCDQLVLMTCEDKKVYGYDGEDMHLVASSLDQLRDKGIEYPASTSYYDGEAFKHMTKKDWTKVRQGAVGNSLDQAHHKLVTAKKSRFLEKLKFNRHNTGVVR